MGTMLHVQAHAELNWSRLDLPEALVDAVQEAVLRREIQNLNAVLQQGKQNRIIAPSMLHSLMVPRAAAAAVADEKRRIMRHARGSKP